MIYTVTFNPAIDYLVFMDQLKIGATNRTASEEYFYGGKGINVSTILSTLGVENTALGFVSGWTGKALVEGLQEKGIRTDFIELDPAGGITRVNVKIKGETDPATGRREETEINGLFNKGNDSFGAAARNAQNRKISAGNGKLENKLLNSGKAEIAFFYHLCVVVNKADDPVCESKTETGKNICRFPGDI